MEAKCEFCGGDCPEILESKYPWFHEDYDSICTDWLYEELKDLNEA